MLVRHAESLGNVARQAAERAGAAAIDIAERDMDVDLSDRGQRQAEALGVWLAGLGHRQPTVALTSPYVRTRRTAQLALAAGGPGAVELRCDERLREREFGAFDRLTRRGLTERFPQEWAARVHLGKFYHRPPGGESWCDVALRVRSLLDSVTREHSGERVALFTHEVVILVFRYVLEHLEEEEVLRIGRSEQLANCGVTEFEFDPSAGRRGGMRLLYHTEPTAMEDAGVAITKEPDAAAPQ
ncbi:MAG TPA: histidine phosphatase family protein [Acidimicrobiia bacterium]|nr:histidine phosphatase family protein [Acidimicrobiia bacterium]